MSTVYTRRVTIVVPVSEMPDANQLALVLGETRDDDQTFTGASFEDVTGNMYAVSSTVATQNFEVKAATTLATPPHAPHADLVAAARAQSLVYIYGVHGTDGAALGRIWVYVENSPGDALAALDRAGVTALEVEI